MRRVILAGAVSSVHSLEISVYCAVEASQTDGGMPCELLDGNSLARSQSCSRDTPFLACECKENKVGNQRVPRPVDCGGDCSADVDVR